MAWLATVASIAGTALEVAGTIKQGQEAKARYQYEQKVQEAQGKEARAAAQREAAAKKREGDFILSKQRAAVAGSGGSTADQSVLDVMGQTAAETDLATRTINYRGEQQQRGYQDAATVSGINARNAETSSYFSAAGSLFSGVSNLYARFGQNQKKQNLASSTVMVPYG